MSLITIEVAIDHGKIVPSEPVELPELGNGLLTILKSDAPGTAEIPRRGRIQFPLIYGEPGEVINPTHDELDASLWD